MYGLGKRRWGVDLGVIAGGGRWQREACDGRIVFARLLDSTNAAGQSLPHPVMFSHHVILGFQDPAAVQWSLSLGAGQKQVVGSDVRFVEAFHSCP